MTYLAVTPGSRRHLAPLGLGLTLAFAPLIALGCSDDSADPAAEHAGGSGGEGASSNGGKGSVLPSGGADTDQEGAAPVGGASEEGGAPASTEPSLYAISAIAFGDESTSTYLSLLESLDVEETDFGKAREYPGQADIWVHEGALYVAESDKLTITKYTVESGKLVEGDAISFANYGLTDFGFWVNVFVAPDKAYLQNTVAEYVIWNPETMEITGTLPLPELAPRDGKVPFLGYADRSAKVRDGLVYQTVYYTDDTFFEFDAGSQLLVIDTKTDEVVDTLEVPCPGVDFSTSDADGNLYFSSWVFAPGGAAVLDQPTTCVAKLGPKDKAPTKLFDLPAVTDGREGGVMRYLGDGKALLSVLHDDNSTATTVEDISYGANWRFWLYDLEAGTAEPVDSLDWNAGAAYPFDIGGKPYMLVPGGGYATTQLYRLGADGAATPLVKSLGWSLRLFALP